MIDLRNLIYALEYGNSRYMVGSWNAWHRHMKMVMLAMLILISYQMKFRKLQTHASIPAVIEIMKFHNPLNMMNTTPLAWKINQDDEMRVKARLSRLKGHKV